MAEREGGQFGGGPDEVGRVCTTGCGRAPKKGPSNRHRHRH